MNRLSNTPQAYLDCGMSNSDIFRCYFSDLKAAALCLGPSQLYIACDIAEGRERERKKERKAYGMRRMRSTKRNRLKCVRY